MEDGVECAVKIYYRHTLERKIKGNGVILLVIISLNFLP